MNLGKPIAQGNTAKIYLSDNKIIKVFNDHLSDSEPIKEAAKQQTAYSYGLPVPKVIDVTKINGKRAVIMEYIQGDTLGDLLLKNKEKAEIYLSLSIDIQMKIHNIEPDSQDVESMKDKLARQIESVHQLDKNQKNNLIEELDLMTYENRLCHGDFHLFNLIQTSQQIVIIDWVDASVGDIHADVFRTYLLYSQVSTDLAEMYLNLYCEKSEMLKADVLKWAPILAAAHLSESVSTDNTEQLMKIINRLEK